MSCRITPSFVFPNNAEEVVKFYLSVFPDSKLISKQYYPENAPGPAGTIATISFELMGIHMVAVNAKGDNFNFGQGLSLQVECDDQGMIDSITKKMLAGGSKQQDCGWVVDPYGVSWQIVPKLIREVLDDAKDKAKVERVFHAVWQMKKIDVDEIQRAANGN
jgi:predicted 3-demethylubiquinone-9 3-methyltransferase (glyoxalase superfamily)